MDQKQQTISQNDAQENVLFGVVGAFLFSLAGGILYYVLYQVGFIASLSGLVGVVCAIKGYAIFAKKESVRGVVISIIMAALVLVIAWYICLANDVYLAYQEWYAAGEVDFTLTLFESVSVAYLFLMDFPEYFIDLGLGLLFAALGCGSYVANMIKKTKAAQAAANAPVETVAETVEAIEATEATEVPEEQPAEETENNDVQQ